MQSNYQEKLKCDLNKLGQECDLVIDSANLDKINRKISELLSCLKEISSDFGKMHIHYFLANLFSAKASLCRETTYSWIEDKHPKNLIKQINSLRKSYQLSADHDYPVKFEIQTNLANILTMFGRHIEAMQLWQCDFSLKGDAPFVSSYNKARILRFLSQYLEDSGHTHYYNLEAYQILKNLRNKINETLHNKIKKAIMSKEITKFLQQYDHIVKQSKYCSITEITYKSQYNCQGEEHYHKWLLSNCLFLNPLNDITTLPVAEHDILQFPTYTTEHIKDGPYLPAAFSAIKRKYSYARFLLFEGLHNINCPIYESKGLNLTSLHDGNYYDLATEKIKNAFQLVFGIFDNLSTLLFKYFHPENSEEIKVQFNGRWLKENFSQFDNPFIKTLYWIACDLTDIDVNDSKWNGPNPDAKMLRQVRNALEHNWLRISDGISTWDNTSRSFYAYTIKSQELKEQAVKLFQLARSSIMTSVFAVKFKELEKNKTTDANVLSTSETVPIWKP